MRRASSAPIRTTKFFLYIFLKLHLYKILYSCIIHLCCLLKLDKLVQICSNTCSNLLKLAQTCFKNILRLVTHLGYQITFDACYWSILSTLTILYSFILVHFPSIFSFFQLFHTANYTYLVTVLSIL